MSEITSAISTANRRRIHIRRARLACLNGKEQGNSWLMEREVIHIGSLDTGDVVLTDSTVSRRHAEISRTPDGFILRDLGSTNGTFVGPVRVKEVFLAPDTHFRVGRSELVFTPIDEVIEVEPSQAERFEGLVGQSVVMRELFNILERIAPTDLTVLISGETGTGKELASRAVHERSRRKGKAFVVFDCGAAPANLIESELFGHERGAYTGAVESRAGVFEQADGGTIFLDEIGELPKALQPKLLRVLEQREVRRLGASKSKAIDVRVVVATNRDLRLEIEAGRFRADLFYRLAVVELKLPPLRERMSDLLLLEEHLLTHAPHNPGVQYISTEVEAIFQSYHWPGNVRELKNVIERALPFCDGPEVRISALPDALRGATKHPLAIPTKVIAPNHDASVSFKDAKDSIIDAFERQYLVDLLEQHGGNVSRAARTADMDRKSITRLMKKHEITRR